MSDGILTAEQAKRKFLALTADGYPLAAKQWYESHERLREQRDEGMKREADFIKKWADAEDRLARTTNEAKRQFEEWAEHLRACSDQCAKAEEKIARVTAALERIVWLRISDPPAQVVAREALALLTESEDSVMLEQDTE